MAEVAKTPDFYLALTDGCGLDVPRKCWRRRAFKTDYGKDLLLVRVEPPLLYQNHDVEEVILAARHVGYSVAALESWPIHVHVARWRADNEGATTVLGDIVPAGQLEVLVWAALYESEAAAVAAVKGCQPRY